MEAISHFQAVIKTCEKHGDRELIMYCKDCRKPICSYCARHDHKEHEYDGIREAAKECRINTPQICADIRENCIPMMETNRDGLREVLMSNNSLLVWKSDHIKKNKEEFLMKSAAIFDEQIDHCISKVEQTNTLLEKEEKQLSDLIDDIQKKTTVQENHYTALPHFDLLEMQTALSAKVNEYSHTDPKKFAVGVSIKESELDEDTLKNLILTFAGDLEFPSSKTIRKQQREFSEIISTESTKATSGQELDITRSTFRTKEGLCIKVYAGSILKVQVEGIVNAANGSLSHGGGVAYIISRAAGYEFDRESRKYVTKYGQIQTGQCCVTSAGDLHYKCVIHCVGPRWSDYQDKGVCAAVLRGAIVNVLHAANTRNLKSVGILSISSGIYPMELIKLGKGWFDRKPVKHSS